LPRVKEIVSVIGVDVPAQVERDEAITTVARRVVAMLRQRLSESALQAAPQDMRDNLRAIVTPEMVGEAVDSTYRSLAFGVLRAKDRTINESQLAADLAPASRWRVEASGPAGSSQRSTDAVAYLLNRTVAGKPAAEMVYDFSKASVVRLTGEFDLPFATSELRNIQIAVRPDDTWHSIHGTIEHDGVRYESERPWVIADIDWSVITLQHESDDDRSTKIRTWTVVRRSAQQEGALNEPGKVRITLEVRKSSQLEAWAHKLTRNYSRTAEQMPFWRYVTVSLFLVIANVVLTVLASSFVAYAFARIVWPGREFCFVLMLATMMIPGQVTMIPNFLIWKTLGAYDTLTPLWLGAAFGNAFFIFLLRQFMKTIPRDLEEAARIDGCGFLRIYWHVILPLIKPSLAAIAIFTFLGTWNDFLGPLLYIADQRLYPLAFGLYAFSVQIGSNNPALALAGSVLMTLPVIVVFFFAQRYFIQGVTLTGMKG
jgi:ABC-type glycerol-3-phosphate transport system permease component